MQLASNELIRMIGSFHIESADERSIGAFMMARVTPEQDRSDDGCEQQQECGAHDDWPLVQRFAMRLTVLAVACGLDRRAQGACHRRNASQWIARSVQARRESPRGNQRDTSR